MFYLIIKLVVIKLKYKKGNINMSFSNPIPDIDDEIKDVNEVNQSDYTSLNGVYFAFIDVLGFKKTFDDIKISNENEIANKYRDVFNYYFSLMNVAKFMDKDKNSHCYAGQTSDSLYFYTRRPDYLMQFIKIFSHFSLYAMSKNVFFRGGIAKGTIYQKEQYQFYGDCIIGAYLLESNISKNPIVVIDKKTDEDMKKISGYEELIDTYQDRKYIKPFQFLDKKNVLDIDEGFKVRDIDRIEIEKNILKNKEAFEYDPSNYAKYVFLLDQFEKSNNNV